MTTKKNDEVQVIKKKPRGGNSPVIGNNGLMLEDGDNAKFLMVNMTLFNMTEIDRSNLAAVQERLNDFFRLYAENDMKPTVAGMAMALGMNRRTLWAITHDAPIGGRGNYSTLPQEVTDIIKKAYFLLENLWETYMASGKINPMAGVFLGVNNYGYQDVKRVDVAPIAPENTEKDYDPEAIRQQYLIDSVPSSDSGNE